MTGTRESHGIDFSKIVHVEYFQEGPARIQPIAKFEGAGLHTRSFEKFNLELWNSEPTSHPSRCSWELEPRSTKTG
jgi:hypothetical protein